jgi:hypothetical protein
MLIVFKAVSACLKHSSLFKVDVPIPVDTKRGRSLARERAGCLEGLSPGLYTPATQLRVAGRPRGMFWRFIFSGFRYS